MRMKLVYPLLAASLLLSGCSVFQTPSKRVGAAWADDVIGQKIKAEHETNEKNFKKSKRMSEEN
jgi:hypothetical protein